MLMINISLIIGTYIDIFLFYSSKHRDFILSIVDVKITLYYNY